MSGTADPGSDAIAEREIISTRLFDAPRELLFRAFIDPVILARWWGPEGFTNTFQQFDPRPGGSWRFVMRGPDGAEYAMDKRFVEVVAPERIVVDHLEPVQHRFRMTMTFAEEAGRTRTTWRMVFESAEEAGKVWRFIVQANEQNFDRLGVELAALASAGSPKSSATSPDGVS
jgi:uncharacterized protein YndB with AHSA1/START domain